MYSNDENSLKTRIITKIIYLIVSPKTAIPKGRRRLAAVIQAAGDIIRISDAERALGIGRSDAAKLLSRWSAQAWMRRVGPGAYAAVDLDTLTSERVLDDPWVLVPALFQPAYIGGRTAAQHWELTEQIFRDIVVMSARTVRVKNQHHHGAHFTLKHVQHRRIFGTKTVWRGKTQIAISDVHRTIIDMLDDPSLGSGIQHVADCLATYFEREDRDDDKLMSYAGRLGNGTVFKRLGIVAERRPDTSTLVEACLARLTQGNSKLDPAIPCPRLISRWRLFVPESWARAASV